MANRYTKKQKPTFIELVHYIFDKDIYRYDLMDMIWYLYTVNEAKQMIITKIYVI